MTEYAGVDDLIISAIRKHRGKTAPQYIVARTGLSLPLVMKRLEALRRAGQISYIGRKTWKIY